MVSHERPITTRQGSQLTLVICPNLAIDRVFATDRLRPGGITRGHALRVQAGGKGANALRATLALGGSGTLVGFAAGHGGRQIEELALQENLELETIATGGEARVSTVVLGDDGSVTRLYEHGPAATHGDEARLVALAGRRAAQPGEWAVLDGAAPPGVSPGFYAALVRAARAAGYRVLVDADGEQLAGALATHPDLVKINFSEACSALGEPRAHCVDEQGEPESLATAGLELSRRLLEAGADGAVLTLGAAGAVGVLEGADWRITTPPVSTVNPVGSGDCFAAALALALQRGEAVAAALRLAAGAGAANAASPYTGHVDPELAQELAGAACAGPPARAG
jgi:1-phosphofructokinase family hexose kinase